VTVRSERSTERTGVVRVGVGETRQLNARRATAGPGLQRVNAQGLRVRPNDPLSLLDRLSACRDYTAQPAIRSMVLAASNGRVFRSIKWLRILTPTEPWAAVRHARVATG
jgi:hypothetical protein